jgi:hypothetical protein
MSPKKRKPSSEQCKALLEKIRKWSVRAIWETVFQKASKARQARHAAEVLDRGQAAFAQQHEAGGKGLRHTQSGIAADNQRAIADDYQRQIWEMSSEYRSIGDDLLRFAPKLFGLLPVVDFLDATYEVEPTELAQRLTGLYGVVIDLFGQAEVGTTERATANQGDLEAIREAIRAAGKNATPKRLKRHVQMKRQIFYDGLRQLSKTGEYQGHERGPRKSDR